MHLGSNKDLLLLLLLLFLTSTKSSSNTKSIGMSASCSVVDVPCSDGSRFGSGTSSSEAGLRRFPLLDCGGTGTLMSAASRRAWSFTWVERDVPCFDVLCSGSPSSATWRAFLSCMSVMYLPNCGKNTKIYEISNNRNKWKATQRAKNSASVPRRNTKYVINWTLNV